VDALLQSLITALLAARDSGQISRDRAAQAIGQMTLDPFDSRTCEEQSWRKAMIDAGVPDELIDAAYVALVERLDPPDDRPTTAADDTSPSGGAVERVIAHAGRTLGDPTDWAEPTTYGSAALAIIDAIWSIGVKYTGVLNVIERYRRLRAEQGADANDDTPAELIELIEALGGAEAFAGAVENRQRTSSRNGILKAEAVLLAGRVLVSLGLERPADVLAANDDQLDALRGNWTQIRGQGSGISLDYFLMLNGFAGVKGDRMIRRFVAEALGLSNELSVDSARAVGLVRDAARRIGVDDRRLDFAIWEYESERAGR
jgi:hypothetical protein